MSLEVNEKISSFYDDELDASDDRDHIINRLKNDTDMQNTWHRYGLIGDALKKNLPDNVEHNLFSRVQSAMESEPAHASASTYHGEVKATGASVVELPKKSSNNKISNHPALGFGIAASVALVSVLGFQMFSSTSDVSLQQEIASTQQPVITQELNIVASNDAGVAIISVAEDASASTYAEQSIMDDGQWTRITPMDSVSLENELFLGKPETRVNIDLQNSLSPLARSVSLDKSSSE